MNDWSGYATPPAPHCIARDKTFAEHAEEYTAWADTRATDLDEAQSLIDHLCARMRQMERQMEQKNKVIRFQVDMEQGYLRRIVDLEIEAARLKGEAQLTRDMWR